MVPIAFSVGVHCFFSGVFNCFSDGAHCFHWHCPCFLWCSPLLYLTLFISFSEGVRCFLQRYPLLSLTVSIVFWRCPLFYLTVPVAFSDDSQFPIAFSGGAHCCLWPWTLLSLRVPIAFSDIVHCFLWRRPLIYLTIPITFCDGAHCVLRRCPLLSLTAPAAFSDDSHCFHKRCTFFFLRVSIVLWRYTRLSLTLSIAQKVRIAFSDGAHWWLFLTMSLRVYNGDVQLSAFLFWWHPASDSDALLSVTGLSVPPCAVLSRTEVSCFR